MDKLLASIATRLTYITSNSTNAFILKTCGVIDTKLDDIRNRVCTTEELVNMICDRIINYDISQMKRVAGETNMVYKKMDELAGFVEQIKTEYWNVNE